VRFARLARLQPLVCGLLEAIGLGGQKVDGSVAVALDFSVERVKARGRDERMTALGA
jgi:hypothetical protein